MRGTVSKVRKLQPKPAPSKKIRSTKKDDTTKRNKKTKTDAPKGPIVHHIQKFRPAEIEVNMHLRF